ncbi:MAG: hypothetical protein R2729_22095 [Bryobacteraceae bacterium]
MRRTSRFSTAAAALALAGCVSQPDYYAPPEQRKAIAGPDTSRLKYFIRFNDPAAEDHILRDVGERIDDESWRWTGQRPLLRFVVPKIDGLRFVMDFAFNSETMSVTGPVTVRFAVNGHLLGTETYSKDGGYRFEKPVPPDWLKDGEDVVAGADLDKVWVSPADGARLGMILNGAGFLD